MHPEFSIETLINTKIKDMDSVQITKITPLELEILVHDAVCKALQEQVKQPETDRFLDLNDLVRYDPEKRSKPTFYGYIHNRAIPFHKRGKKVTFLKSEIDSWLKEGRRKTRSEIEAGAIQNLIIRRDEK